MPGKSEKASSKRAAMARRRSRPACMPGFLTGSDNSRSSKNDVKASVGESRKSGSSINSHNNRNVSSTHNRATAAAATKSSASKPTESAQGTTGASEEFDLDKEVEVELKNMHRIESARAQWREKEEARLEESWNALSLFDRNQKTRLSLDLENDILDEYLNSERNKPRVPTTIQEEPDVTQPDVNTVDDEFEIPVLPKGRLVIIDIKSTWGDRHYVGLNGVEIFTDTGEMPEIDSIRAEPKDINVLPEYDKDPRVVDNLLDGINRTRDDTHMWLAPFSKGKDHKVFITFKRPAQIAMIRIWVRLSCFLLPLRSP